MRNEIGKPIARFDGRAKVTGDTLYTADLSFPGLVWGKCLRSPLPHARILEIDTSEAKRLKGVVAVLTASDITTRLHGRRLKDIPGLAQGKVRFVGEKVAAVGAESPEIAEEALNRIKVDYEELKAVYDPLEAMSPGAPILHEKLATYENLRLPVSDLPNVHSHMRWQTGDCEKGFQESDFIFEQTFTTQRVHHGYLEPHAAVVHVDSSGRTLVWSPAKGPYATRQQLADWLEMEESRIVLQLCSIGGDFGGRGALMDIPVCYYLAKATGRPTKMVMSYSEELTAAAPRHPSVITLKTGVKKDGRLAARRVKAIFNSGAYAGFKNNVTVNLPGARDGAGAYRIPDITIDAYSVYTNCVPSGIMRGPGEPQLAFAVESHMDYIARELRLDPFELRRLNVLRRGDRLPDGKRLENDKGLELLDRMARKIRWGAKKSERPYAGKGIALSMKGINIGEANIEVGFKQGGTLYIKTTVPDTGTGTHTILRQIVGETLNIPAQTIDVVIGNTDTFPTDVMVSASRVTYLAGRAAQKAANDLRERLIGAAANHFGWPRESIRITRGTVCGPNHKKIPFAEIASLTTGLKTIGNFNVKEQSGLACFYGQAAEVRVDPETGELKILKIVCAHDVGTIIHPVAHQGQVDGAMIQGLGFALSEHLVDEEGKIITANLGEYKLPNVMDVPRHETVLVHDPDGPGPFQSKPIGEHGTVPTAPAIANALYDALDVQITDLPITAEKIYRALKQKKNAACSGVGLRRDTLQTD